MSSTDHTSTIYDIIFVGGIFKLYSICQVVVVLIIGSGGAAACVTAGRLAEADPSLKILVSVDNVWSIHNFLIDPQSLRSWKLVHIPVKNRIIYSRRAVSAVSSAPQKHLRFMWQSLVQLCMIVQWSFLQVEPLAVDLA
jgi:hypothetical protein